MTARAMRLTTHFAGVLMLVLVAGCSTAPADVPTSEAATLAPAEWEPPTAWPSETPLESSQAAEWATSTPFPWPTTTTSASAPILMAPLRTAEPPLVSVLAPPPYPVPWAIKPFDHFYFRRPIPSDFVTWPNSTYRYGNTDSGEEPTHTGVDLVAKRGTPVQAAADGEVVWTGYGLYRGVYDPSDPYGLAIAIRHDFGFEGQALYTVYAHLDRIDVWLGQRVRAGDPIGIVGLTGHTNGPHLHFEVRLGENRYFSTRNPELWIVPPQGWGVLAGRILDTLGRPIPEQLVEIQNLDTQQTWQVLTYAQDTVNADDHYQENFVVSDLPAGVYEVTTHFVGHAYSCRLYLNPGETNFVEFNGRAGFTLDPTPTP